MSLNQVVLMGRLTRDPELKSTQSGVDVATFTLAVDRSYIKAGAEKESDFLDCVAWRGTAEFISRYFKKGMQVAVTGRIQTRKWKDQNDQNRVSVEVVADEVFFADSKREPSTGGTFASPAPGMDAPAPNYGAPSFQSQDTSFEDLSADDDELPF